MLICASYIMVYLHFYFNYRVIFCVYMIRVYRCCAVSSYFESLSLMSVSRSLCYDNKNSAKFVLVSFFLSLFCTGISITIYQGTCLRGSACIYLTTFKGT